MSHIAAQGENSVTAAGSADTNQDESVRPFQNSEWKEDAAGAWLLQINKLKKRRQIGLGIHSRSGF